MTQPAQANKPLWPWFLGLSLALLIFRLISLGWYPLMDTSEARYGEIARVMVQTGNWVTPQEWPGNPFWAKPPLSTWLSAVSIQMFGVSEFAVRLPAMLCALLVLGMTGVWAKTLSSDFGREQSGLAIALLMASVGFFAAAGAVMTDPCLVVCTCAMQLCLYQCLVRGGGSVWYRYGFFAAAGLGMLAKGPVILVYVGFPAFLWLLLAGEFGLLWRRLPWIRGTALALLICAPWYALAEHRTPGFMSYFLVGEHLMRFLKPGWGGDLYGTAHAEPTGTIWLYFLGAIGAQLVLLVFILFRLGALRFAYRSPSKPFNVAQCRASPIWREQTFIWLNALLPLFFFTFAGNIIWTYVLPALPAFAVGLASLLYQDKSQSGVRTYFIMGCLGVNAILLVVAYTSWVPHHVRQHSSADLITQIEKQVPGYTQDIYYLGRKSPASLRFYTKGRTVTLNDSDSVAQVLGAKRPLILALPRDQADHWQVLLPAGSVFGSSHVVAQNTDLTLLRVEPAVTP